MPGDHLIVTIAKKSVSEHSDQMLTIPAIVTIAIAGIGSGSIPAIASAIVTITAIIWTQASDRERSERSSYFPRSKTRMSRILRIFLSNFYKSVFSIFIYGEYRKLGFQTSEMFKHPCFRYLPIVKYENLDV